MKYLLIILFAFTTYAQNVWYVNRDATGANTGRNWTDAWTDFDSTDYWGNGTGINWAIIGTGDTIYVSGGTDSTVYNTNSPNGIEIGNVEGTSGVYTFASQVVITPAWHTNHNGGVYFVSDDDDNEMVLSIGNISNLKVRGINIIDRRTLHGGGMVKLGNADNGDIDSLIVLDSCYIYSKGFASLVTLSGSKNTFSNNYMETAENQYGFENDQFGVNGGRGGHTIDNNIMIARSHFNQTDYSANVAVTATPNSFTDTRLSMATNAYLGTFILVGDTVYMNVTSNDATTFYGTGGWLNLSNQPATTQPNGTAYTHGQDAHRDGIQISNIGYFQAPERLQFTISNNLYVDFYSDGSYQNNMIYYYGALNTNDTRMVIYNNILVNRKEHSGIGGIAIGRDYVGAYAEFNSVYILNNTVISKGNGSGSMFTGWSADTLVLKNNLFVKDSTAPNIINFENGYALWQGIPKDINYNYYGVYGGSQNPFAVVGDNKTWAQWLTEDNTLGASNGSHVDSAGSFLTSSNIAFTDKYGITKADYYTITGRDSAVDLSATYTFLSIDALGNSRSGSWDIGALEFIDETPTDTTNNWYVDRDATGAANGTSWTDAEVSLSNCLSNAIEAGDTIFISGGADSTTYAPISIWSKKYSSQIVITKGTDTGHNGDVYFVNPNDVLAYTFVMGSSANITIDGLHFRTLASTDDSARVKSLVRSNDGKNIIIKNCNIVSNGLGTGVYLSGDTNTVVTNNHIEVLTNNYASICDVFYSATGTGGKTITGNTLIQNGVKCSYSHKDLIQFSQEGVESGDRPLITIANNLMLALNTNTDYCAGINGEYRGNRILIYNNIITQHTGGNLGIVAYDTYPYPSSMRIFNNTIINGSGQNIQLNGIDTFIVKNNIFYLDTTTNNTNLLFPEGFSEVEYADIDYNLYYNAFGDAPIDTNTGGRVTFAQWQALGYETNGLNTQPTFVDRWGTNINDYTTEAGRDVGLDLSAYFATDIIGKPRTGGWDMGALEYTTGGWTPPDTTGTVSFTSVTNANLNSYHIAYGVVSGIDSTSHIYTATSDSFAVGYPYALNLTMQEIENGDTIAVSNIASGSYLTANVSIVIVSGTNRTFTVTTKDIDSLPNAFTFTDINNADLSTAYTSNGVTLAGFDSAYAYAGGNVYTVNGGSDLTGYTRVFPNDVLRLKVTSSASYSTAVNSTLTVGTRSDTYRVTTKANPAARSRVIIIGANNKAIRFPDGKFMVSE